MEKKKLRKLIIMVVAVTAIIANMWGRLFPTEDELPTYLETNYQGVGSDLTTDETTTENNPFSEEQLSKYWHKATFDTVEDSMAYHLKKHGKGRTMAEYTQVAVEFYEKYKGEGRTCTLKDKTPGLKIEVGQGKHEKGGYWTSDGKIVTFWD